MTDFLKGRELWSFSLKPSLYKDTLAFLYFFGTVVGTMPITKGAKKAVRNADKKRVFNLRRTRKVQGATKDVEKLVQAGDIAGAQTKLSDAYKAIDKAAKMNTIKKNTASRRKSRLAGIIKRAKATK